MGQMIKYKGTTFLLMTSIILQVLCSAFPSLTDHLCFTFQVFTWPITLFTHMVAHAGWGHLIGNYTFGLAPMMYVERQYGRKGLMNLFFLCGLTGALMNVIVHGDVPCIGSSGAIFGMMAVACVTFGRSALEHLLALGLLLCVLVPQICMAPFSFLTGIAHWAHIGGALGGILLTHKLFRPLPCKPPKKK